jgi:hypothetical protein
MRGGSAAAIFLCVQLIAARLFNSVEKDDTKKEKLTRLIKISE